MVFQINSVLLNFIYSSNNSEKENLSRCPWRKQIFSIYCMWVMLPWQHFVHGFNTIALSYPLQLYSNGRSERNIASLLQWHICQCQSLPSGHVSVNLSYMTLTSTQLIPPYRSSSLLFAQETNTMLSITTDKKTICYHFQAHCWFCAAVGHGNGFLVKQQLLMDLTEQRWQMKMRDWTIDRHLFSSVISITYTCIESNQISTEHSHVPGCT